MRVVGGNAGGRRLKAPSGRSTRPTTDRVRESIFDMLASVGALEEARVLDLFVGSGALGIEALSRGGVFATFVDRDPKAVAAIESNLKATGLAPRGAVVRSDVLRWLRRKGRAGAGLEGSGGEAVNVAFCDPPYAFSAWPELMAALTAELVVVESKEPLGQLPDWRAVKARTYGGTVVTLMEPLPPVSVGTV